MGAAAQVLYIFAETASYSHPYLPALPQTQQFLGAKATEVFSTTIQPLPSLSNIQKKQLLFTPSLPP